MPVCDEKSFVWCKELGVPLGFCGDSVVTVVSIFPFMKILLRQQAVKQDFHPVQNWYKVGMRLRRLCDKIFELLNFK